MPKDNENIPLSGPLEPSEPQGFSAEQMIRCEECLRANPPTRVSCLYCLAPLPLTESTRRLRKPVLRQPQKHQSGYNSILIPQCKPVNAEVIAEAATLLKLTPLSVQQLLTQDLPLPVARTDSSQEAELVCERLRELGLDCRALADEDLGLSPADSFLKRAKAMSFAADSLSVYQAGAGEVTSVPWTDVSLIVPGRLFETRLEIKERLTRQPEKELLDASEFFKDEAVVDFYVFNHPATWRVQANGFDFSCLAREKALFTNENIGKLQQLLATKAVNANLDDSYSRVRSLLELAWTTQPETQSSGWRRERPGLLSVGQATIRNNETQFTRYSRLRHYFTMNPAT